MLICFRFKNSILFLNINIIIYIKLHYFKICNIVFFFNFNFLCTELDRDFYSLYWTFFFFLILFFRNTLFNIPIISYRFRIIHFIFYFNIILIKCIINIAIIEIFYNSKFDTSSSRLNIF